MSVSGVFQILRRLAGGANGAPNTLLAGQLFSNENENVIYVGTGNNGSGVSTGQVKVGGAGAFVDLASTQTVVGTKTFSSSPQLPSPSANDNTASAAPTSWVQAFVTAITNVLAPKASPTFTGTVTVPTPAAGSNTTVAASTAFVASAVAPLAPIASPIFTGAPQAPTPAAGDSSNNVSTTSFVQTALSQAVQNLQWKPTAKAATAAVLPSYTYLNGVITATGNGALVVDGVSSFVAGTDLVLVLKETGANQPYNGEYVVTSAGSASAPFVLTRSSYMNQAGEFPGALVPVSSAAVGVGVNGNSLWLCNPASPVTVGTTAIPFTQLNGATDLLQGAGITISGNTISLPGIGSISAGSMLKWNGTGFVLAVAGTDYVAPGSTFDSGTA